MITAAALCPHPPLLLRELTGQADLGAGLRASCVSAVVDACRGADTVVVVGGCDTGGEFDGSQPFHPGRFGGSPLRATARTTTGPGLPLSLGVGRRLLTEAGWTGPARLLGLGWNASDGEVRSLAGRIVSVEHRRHRVALLVLGDGSARRGEKAPGYLDDRAFDFDDSVAKALDAGDAAALAGIDVPLAAELMVLGGAALRMLGTVALAQGEVDRARLIYNDDPFGVSYFVALWRFTAPLSGGSTAPR